MKKIFTKSKSANKKVVVKLDEAQITLIKQGREEFKKLLEKGMSVPVALL